MLWSWPLAVPDPSAKRAVRGDQALLTHSKFLRNFWDATPPKKMHQAGDVLFLLVLERSGRVLPVMSKAMGSATVFSSIAEVFVLYLCCPGPVGLLFQQLPFLSRCSCESAPLRHISASSLEHRGGSSAS